MPKQDRLDAVPARMELGVIYCHRFPRMFLFKFSRKAHKIPHFSLHHVYLHAIRPCPNPIISTINIMSMVVVTIPTRIFLSNMKCRLCSDWLAPIRLVLYIPWSGIQYSSLIIPSLLYSFSSSTLLMNLHTNFLPADSLSSWSIINWSWTK